MFSFRTSNDDSGLPDMEQFNELTRQLFFSNNNVKRLKTLVSMSRGKVDPTVSVDLKD